MQELAGDVAPARVSLTRHRPSCVVVSVSGCLDARSVDRVRAELEPHPAPGTDVLVADWSGVSFCSVEGVRLLLDLRARARKVDVPLPLVARSLAVCRPLEVLGLSGEFRRFDDRTSALRAFACRDDG
ncbi:hypothetical protein BAY60_22815 [Prauserella muralis]|uniref:STAS domain-containing protein n=1 Tax=Prauserella muralis TaxID=588067 RepID=A0A2V4ARK1_9PSEU|nr:hypothetical protein BAY60_22815 [Prauserella muralis]